MRHVLELRALRAVSAGSCAPCAVGRERRAACAVCYSVCWRVEVVLYALEMLKSTRRVLICGLEAVEGELCLLEMPEVMRCVLLCIRRLRRVGSICWRCRR